MNTKHPHACPPPEGLLAQLVALLQQKPERLNIARIEEALGGIASPRSHEGNIARFRLRPSEFSRWKAA